MTAKATAASYTREVAARLGPHYKADRLLQELLRDGPLNAAAVRDAFECLYQEHEEIESDRVEDLREEIANLKDEARRDAATIAELRFRL